MYRNLLLAALSLVVLAGCITPTPVRTNVFDQKPTQADEKHKAEAAHLKPTKASGRFSDTVVYDPPAQPINFSKRFSEGQSLFEKEKFKEGCQIFTELSETINPEDSMYFEVRYMLTECALVNSELDNAEKILSQLSENPSTPNPVLEKVLVRLGQVYCVLQKDAEAKLAFLRLKKEFPRSAYLKQANCDAVKRKEP